MKWKTPTNAGRVRILLLGKRGSLVLWLENLCRACTQMGHTAHVFAINGDSFSSWLRVKWQGRDSASADWMLARFEQKLARFRPDLVLVVGVFGVPMACYRILHTLARRPLIAGLVGDRFPVDSRDRADACDRLYFTDTRFFHDAEVAGFTTTGCYLPLAVDPTLFTLSAAVRRPELLFVASRTPFREAVVRGLELPARVIGTDWSHLARDGIHQIKNRKIHRSTLIRLYQQHQAVLNVRNEVNIEYGLNQRSFEPLACGALVLNDDLRDLPLCFDPGREILVYRDADELNALVEQVQHDQVFAARIAAAGRCRVLAEHTYVHRVRAMLSDLNL